MPTCDGLVKSQVLHVKCCGTLIIISLFIKHLCNKIFGSIDDWQELHHIWTLLMGCLWMFSICRSNKPLALVQFFPAYASLHKSHFMEPTTGSTILIRSPSIVVVWGKFPMFFKVAGCSGDLGIMKFLLCRLLVTGVEEFS